MTETVRQEADRLYATPPRQFVAERNAAVAAARQAGDRQAASALGKLRRPTVAAWVVNLLALRRPELVAEFAELAQALRTAQTQLAGDQLRELAGQRRATVSRLVSEAGALATGVDPGLAAGKLPLAEVEATLQAALADPELAETVRTGRLLRAAIPEGFGELPAPRLRLVPGTGAGSGSADAVRDNGGVTDPEPAAESGADTGADTPELSTPEYRRMLETELAQARDAAAVAQAEVERCTAEQQDAGRALADVDVALAELTDRRAELAQRLTAAEAASLQARRAAVAARRRVGEALAAWEGGG